MSDIEIPQKLSAVNINAKTSVYKVNNEHTEDTNKTVSQAI
jgi:hypothetical protein